MTGKRGVAEFEGCAPGDLVISDRPMPASVPCRVLGPEALSRTGSLAYYTGKGWVSASEKAGDRLWSPAIHRPPDRLALFGQ